MLMLGHIYKSVLPNTFSPNYPYYWDCEAFYTCRVVVIFYYAHYTWASFGCCFLANNNLRVQGRQHLELSIFALYALHFSSISTIP